MNLSVGTAGNGNAALRPRHGHAAARLRATRLFTTRAAELLTAEPRRAAARSEIRLPVSWREPITLAGKGEVNRLGLLERQMRSCAKFDLRMPHVRRA